jgi:hypothetical protein
LYEQTSIGSQALEEKALRIVQRLEEVSKNHKRMFPSLIDAVLVFSGPGTIYDKLKPGQAEWMRWMDRDRIRAGRAIVAEVTATRLAEHRRPKTSVEDVRNQTLRLPVEKAVIIDQVVEEEGTIHPIRHTADQVKSFYQTVASPQSPLYGVKNVALVAHIPSFIRIPFYTRKYDDQFIAEGHKGLDFWVYALRSRQGTQEPYVASELHKLLAYAELGHLATDPSPFST